MARKGNKRATVEAPKADRPSTATDDVVGNEPVPSVAPAAPQEDQPTPAGVTISRVHGMVIVKRT